MRTAISALPIVFYLVALLLGLLKVDLPFASADLSPLAQWMLFLSLAVQSLWAAFAHVFYTETVARSIGWEPSLFQHEIGGPISASVLALSLPRFLASPRPGRCSSWQQAFSGAPPPCMSPIWSAGRISPSTTPARSSGGTWLTPLTLLIALLWGS